MKKYVAEMIGTMVLVLMGCGSAVIAGAEIGFLGIAFAFGLSVVAMAYAIGGISGCLRTGEKVSGHRVPLGRQVGPGH